MLVNQIIILKTDKVKESNTDVSFTMYTTGFQSNQRAKGDCTSREVFQLIKEEYDHFININEIKDLCSDN